MATKEINLNLTDAQRTLVFEGWLACNFGDAAAPGLTRAQGEACELAGVNPKANILDLPLFTSAELNRLQAACRYSMSPAATLSTVGPSGGYLIAPESLTGRFEVNLLAHGPMRRVAEIIRTDRGGDLELPTVDDTSNIGEQLAESASIGSSNDPTFGSQKWAAYKWSSKVIKFPHELIYDSRILMQVLGDILGERLGRITNRRFTTGTGAATPMGIVTGAESVAAASATAISWADIIGLEAAVDPAYREGAAYMMHSEILETIKNLVDGAGRNRYQERRDPTQPRMLNDYPLYLNADMDSTIASGKKTILFGQLSQYKIRSVGVLRLQHLVERYRDEDAEAAIAFLREDGSLLSAGTAPVKVLAH